MLIFIDSKLSGKLLREFLVRDMGCSSRLLKKLKFTPGAITVNGEFVTVRYRLEKGDTLYLAMEDTAEDTSEYITPIRLPLEVLFEDSHVTVINKPSSMPAHPSLGHRDDTVANALAYRYGDKPYVFRPVNRLDRDTSGVMLTANSHLDAYKLYRAMTGGEIGKSYIALTDGELSGEGVIENYMCLVEGSIVMRRVCTADTPGAKSAVTKWRTVASKNGYSAVAVTPITGRTHQIRVALASVGAPILGDTMYGRESTLISRQALHAVSLTFPHPEKGIMTLRAPVADDIAFAADSLGLLNALEGKDYL